MLYVIKLKEMTKSINYLNETICIVDDKKLIEERCLDFIKNYYKDIVSTEVIGDDVVVRYIKFRREHSSRFRVEEYKINELVLL